jgi:hypothetical protein
MTVLRAIGPLRVLGAVSLVGASLCFAAALSLDGALVWLFALAGLVFAGLSHRAKTHVTRRAEDPKPVARPAVDSGWPPRFDDDQPPVVAMPSVHRPPVSVDPVSVPARPMAPAAFRSAPKQPAIAQRAVARPAVAPAAVVAAPRSSQPAALATGMVASERSLEELRADLARLRENAKARPSVAPPGFLDMVNPEPVPASRPVATQANHFPKTEFGGSSGLPPMPAPDSERDFPRTEIAGLANPPQRAGVNQRRTPEPAFPTTRYVGLEPRQAAGEGAEDLSFPRTQYAGPA